MNKESVIKKLEEGVASLRTVLEQHEGSTLQAIVGTVRLGFESLKTSLAQSESAQKAATEIKKHLDELESAVKKGDKELSGKLLTAIEKRIREYKEKKE